MSEVRGLEVVEKEKEAKMIRIYIMGKEYLVPAGLTIMKAMEYAGYRFIRGCGCRGGFCGACSTVYRFIDDYKLYTGLACQTTVEDGMYLTQLPFVPANKAIYELDEIKPTPNILIKFYPELVRCVSCNTCTKACPQEIEVMYAVQAAIRGDIEEVANLTFDCIQCGLCTIRCPAEIHHYHVFQLARRLYGKYIQPRAKHLEERIREIESGKYDEEMGKLMKMSVEELKKLYENRGRIED
ncbi:MAG TPA: 4Fe-4S dicluster domain-containing protein [Candidatus Korarchaeota archaeon]|nr:4Fe-4S dicluster domain-containing protein [Candidatus Korarchaeota archaeon]